jgi:acyl-CoA thioester hydrolase
MRHAYACPIRWSDMDAYGHVNNGAFVTYLEEARVDAFFRRGAEQGLTGLEGGVVIRRHEIDYLKPVHYTDLLRIELWVPEVRHAYFRVAYEGFVGDAQVCTARSVLVPYDLDAGRLRRLTAAEREWLAQLADEPAERA